MVLKSRTNSTGERGAVVGKLVQQRFLYTSHAQPKNAICNLIAKRHTKIIQEEVWHLIYRRRWLLSTGAYSFSQQENERLTANMRLIGIPLINMGGVIIILWNTAGEALNKYHKRLTTSVYGRALKIRVGTEWLLY